MSAESAYATAPPLYFVCYSRAQPDRDLADKIDAKLAARRRRGELDVWRDVRNLDVWEQFTPAILAVLQRAAGAIVVVSDQWSRSDYIHTYEWPTIHERKNQDPRFQIFLLALNDLDDDDPLRSRNFVNNLTNELLVDCSDAVRDRVLTNLSNLIGAHARTLRPQPADTRAATLAPVTTDTSLPEGASKGLRHSDSVEVLDGVPELPDNFIEPDELGEMTAQLAARNSMAISGLHGEGGTGKSVLAAAVARRAAHLFADGVHWITVGEHATSEDVRRLQADLLSKLGSDRDHAPRNLSDGATMLARTLTDRATLIVIDDVWHPWQSRAFDIARGSQHTRLLFTTRFPEALLGETTTTEIARLNHSEATVFLERLPGGVPDTTEDLFAVLDAAGGLRLALAVLAATASIEGSWAPVLSRLDGLAERFGHGDDASSAQKALFVALDTLDSEDRNLALTLGAFPADVAIPVDLLSELWDIARSRAAQLIDRLAAKDIVVRADDQIMLHDHVHDFLLLEAATPSSEVHLRLWELATEKRRAGWRAFADESPYLWDRLAWHACHAGLNRATLRQFASDLDWLAERIHRQGASAAEQDVGRVCDATALTDMTPLSRLRRVLRHGGLFDAADIGKGLHISLEAWADVIGLGRTAARRLNAGSLPVPSPELRQTFRGHTSEAWSVTFTRDGKRLISCGEDGTARVWDINTAQPLMILNGRAKQLWRLAISRDDRLLATAAADGTAQLWDIGSGELVQTLSAHRGEVWGVAFDSDDGRLATSGTDGTIRVWDIDSGDLRSTFDCGGHPVWDIDFTRDGQRIAAACADGTIDIHDSTDGTPLLRLTGHSGSVRAICFSPDGGRLITGGDDGTARTWDARTGDQLLTLTWHGSVVWDVTFTPDGHRVVTAGADGTARIWDADTGQPLLTLTGNTNSVHGVAPSPNGHRLATVAGDGTARIWDIGTDRPGAPAPATSELHDIALSADNTRLLTAGGDGTARVLEIATGRTLLTLTGHARPVWGAAWSPDNTRIASCGEDRTARIWDARTGECLHTLVGHTSQVWDVGFSHDGRLVATASEDSSVCLWNPEGERVRTLSGHRGRVWEVGFSFDNRRLATGGDDGTVRIWDTDSGEQLLAVEGHTGSIWDVSFSPDDEWVATASEDGTAKLWASGTGELVHVFDEHTGQVWGVTFSSDGRHLATTGGDGTARIWDRATGECLLTLAVACSGPVAWHSELLAVAAGPHWAVITTPDL